MSVQGVISDTASESFKCHLANFKWAVICLLSLAAMKPLYCKRNDLWCADILAGPPISAEAFCFLLERLVTSVTKSLFTCLLSLARWQTQRRVFFSFTIHDVIVLMETLKALDVVL